MVSSGVMPGRKAADGLIRFYFGGGTAELCAPIEVPSLDGSRMLREICEAALEADPLNLRALFVLGDDYTITINGTTGADCAVVLREGNDVEFSPSGGFMLDLVLSEGPNSFELRVADELGNENRTSMHITLDSVAHIEIIAPVNGTVFEVQDIEILVLVEPGAKARLKDGEWHTSDPDGYARIDVSLHFDETTLVLETEDVAGNEGRSSITVYFSPPKQTGENNTMLIIGFIVGLVVIGSVALLVFRSQAAR